MKEKVNIVETYQFGKTTVHIADAYFAKTKEEMERVLDDMHEVGWRIAQEDFEGNI